MINNDGHNPVPILIAVTAAVIAVVVWFFIRQRVF